MASESFGRHACCRCTSQARPTPRAVGQEQPAGLVAHIVVRADGGLRHIGVWDSREDWQHFHDERFEPAVHAVLTAAGFTQMPPDPPIRKLDLVDVWIGVRALARPCVLRSERSVQGTQHMSCAVVAQLVHHVSEAEPCRRVR
jgi:hypothetical protein